MVRFKVLTDNYLPPPIRACLKMLKGMFHEFLESSTIHGLSHISQGESRLSRFLWLVIVATCFGTAIYMITNSYKEWQASPVSTTITTHPITELKFPAVTVCPPKGTNTALNYALRNVKTDSLTDIEREKLKRMAKEVFMENPSRRQARQMKRELSVENMRSILDEEMSFPQIDENNQVTLKFQKKQGSFKTPGFRDPNYKGDFYTKNHSFHLVFEVKSDVFHDNDIVISVQTEGNWSYRIKETGYQVYDRLLSMPEAEKFCISQGGHLASVTSQAENNEIANAASRHSGYVWLGAKRLGITDKMSWLDKREWQYTDWVAYATGSEPTNKIGENCVMFCPIPVSCSGGLRGTWYDDPCDLALRPVCLIPPTAPSVKLPSAASGNDTFLISKQSVSTRSTFQFWWSHEADADEVIGLSPGFQLTWWTQKRTNKVNMPWLQQTFLSQGKESLQESSDRTSENEGLRNHTKEMISRQKRWSIGGLFSGKPENAENAESKSENAESKLENAESKPENAESKPENAESKPEKADWEPKNAKWGMVNLAQTSRLQNQTDLLRSEVLNQRWSIEILEEGSCLGDKKAEFVINQTMERMKMDYKKHPEISDEDIELGVELYSYLHYCDEKVVEAAKLSVFFEELLTNHSLKTVVATTMNNIQPRVGNKLKDLSAMNTWFEYLDKKLNFSLGPIFVELLSSTELRSLLELDPPFLRNYAELIGKCINEGYCGGVANIKGRR